MENNPQSFDVCVVCALPEEARAVLEVMRSQCGDALEERISPRYQYSYHVATLKNNKDELLNLHISWLPRYGPQEMTLHLSRVLEECQPRIVIMTGICAGDAQHVQLGDLIIAERTFTYDNGKFTLDEQGRSVHEHDTLTYQLDANILQFLGVFDKWKSLVTRLKRPSNLSEQRKRRKITCHIKPMASGSAVRADHPFADVRTPVRGTVAIDMEGAAFGLVMSRHPLIRWLIVKGVCDYADRDKSDVYHDYAARASALYALGFIQTYVTNERLPRLGGPSPRNRTGPAGAWNVPHVRNPHFTGRDDLLDRLHQHLTPTGLNHSAMTRRAALTQPLAIKGLGGIGKTQIAVEYAYRSREQGYYTHTLWVNAASEETIISSIVTIAGLLPAFSAKNETDQRKLVEAVKRWLEQCGHPWLLIFDNVDNADDFPIIQQYLPQRGNGSVLLTTRANAVGSLAASIEVEKMGLMEGAQLLLGRAQREDQASDEEINEATNIVIALDCFPLALDQAGAYIEETGCSLVDYLQMYQNRRKELLARRGLQTANYPDSVATTWSLSFQKVERANPAAAELLHLCAFLAPDRIPEELIRDGAAYWSPPLQHAATDLLAFNQMIGELLKFSLVQRLVETGTFDTDSYSDCLVSLGWLKLQKSFFLNTNSYDAPSNNVEHIWEVYLGRKRVLKLRTMKPISAPRGATFLPTSREMSSMLSIHRLVQVVQMDTIEIEEQRLWAKRVVQAVNEVFPIHPEDRLTWPLCNRYLDQVQACDILIEQFTLSLIEAANLLSRTGLYLSDQGEYTIAEPLLKRALAIHEQQSGPDHSDTAQSLNALGNLYHCRGKYTEAEPLLKRALAIHEQQLGPDHSDTIVDLNDLADLYHDQGKYAEVQMLYQRALAICAQESGQEHSPLQTDLMGYAFLYQTLARDKTQERLLKSKRGRWKRLLTLFSQR